MKVVDLIWHRHPIISPDYMADVLTQGRNPKPTVRDEKLKLVGGNPSFLVMRTSVLEKGFVGGNPKKESSANVFNFVFLSYVPVFN